MKHEFRERAARCQNRAELFFDSKKGFSRHRNFPASPRTRNPPLQRNSKFYGTFFFGPGVPQKTDFWPTQSETFTSGEEQYPEQPRTGQIKLF